MKFRLDIVVFITHLTLHSLLVTIVHSESLYNSSDHVVILNHNNINQTVHGTRNAWMVKFYNSWCGHCIHYAPTWKALAELTQGWWPVMKLAAIDCNENVNRPVCRAYHVTSVPALIYIDGANATSTSYYEYEGERSIKDIQRAIIDYVQQQAALRKRGWPKLEPLTKLEDIWNDVTSQTEYVVILIEKASSYMGREVILDMSGYQRLLIRSMLEEDVAKFAMQHVPSLYLISKDGMFHRIPAKNSRSGYGKALRALLRKGLDSLKSTKTTIKTSTSIPSRDASSKPDRKQIDKQVDHKSSKYPVVKQFIGPVEMPRVYMQDLESALYYSLVQEVGGLYLFTDNHLKVLYNYTSVLKKYFPGRPPIVGFLHRLVDWLATVKAPLTGEQWVNSIQKLQTRQAHLPKVVHWVGCAGSTKKYRGYPCAMWTLFHTLTVNAYHMHSKVAKPVSVGVSQEVLLAIRSYLNKFFTCVECSRNFARGAVHIESRVRTPARAVLFLWQSHNKANYHLRGQLSEDPWHPKLQFPPAAVCASCRHSPDVGGSPPDWNEDKVLQFITRMYAPDRIVSAEGTTLTDKVVLMDTRETFFTSIDISMCLMFYILCTVVIILIYFHFVVHRRMSVCKRRSLPL